MIHEIKKRVRFYVQKRNTWEDQNPKIPRSVVMIFSYDGKRLCASTGMKVAEVDWEISKQRVKLNVKRGGMINQYLDQLEQRVNDIYFDAKAKGIVPDSNLFLKELKKNTHKEKPDFFTEWDKYLDIHSKKFRPGTMASMRVTYNKFKDFTKGKRIDFYDITPDLLSRYADYLSKLGNVDNTIHGNIKRMRIFLNYAKRLGLHDNQKYKEFNIPERVGRINYLTTDEVKMLLEYKTKSDTDRKVLDNFLFGCFTAMRYSDYHNLRKEDVKEHVFEDDKDKFFAAHIRQLKTDNFNIVPLLPEALAILDRYKGDGTKYALPRLPDQVINRYMKDIAKDAGLTAKVPVDVYRDQRRQTEHYHKWELMSTHWGRRTFISIAASKGIPINLVASIAGQNPKTTMRHYAGVLDKDRFTKVLSEMKFGGN